MSKDLQFREDAKLGTFLNSFLCPLLNGFQHPVPAIQRTVNANGCHTNILHRLLTFH